MSYSLALDSNGDLKQAGSVIGTVSGIDKLKQDLDIWFRERYQIDRFHPSYGSVLDSHIGGIISSLSIAQITQESSRILSNYQRKQKESFDANPSSFTLDELITSIDSINVQQSLDSIYVNVIFTTASGSVSTINLTTGI
jgi:hypothetical protein